VLFWNGYKNQWLTGMTCPESAQILNVFVWAINPGLAAAHARVLYRFICIENGLTHSSFMVKD